MHARCVKAPSLQASSLRLPVIRADFVATSFGEKLETGSWKLVAGSWKLGITVRTFS
jgi:hypothetical protein